MSNNLEIYKSISIISIGVVVTFVMLLFFFPHFSVNDFYDIGTVLIYSGELKDIPKGWALCDGSNNTPNLIDKFVVGAFTDKYPQVEVVNKGDKVQYVGNGFDPQLVNGTKKLSDAGALGFMTGNIPYTLGQNYNDSTKLLTNGAETKNKSFIGSDHGTNWFKQYVHMSNKEDCSPTNKETLSKYYKTQKGDTNLCHGITKNDNGDQYKDDKYILNDYTMTSFNKNGYDKFSKRLSIGNGEPPEPDFQYYVNINSDTSNILPKELDTNIEIIEGGKYKVKHVPVKRRLFRDYEDYKILLEEGKRLGVSCYDCLPMNHSFTSHSYNFGDVNNTKPYFTLDDTDNIVMYKNQLRLKDYMTNIVYEKPYSNNPSFFKLAYIIRVK